MKYYCHLTHETSMFLVSRNITIHELSERPPPDSVNDSVILLTESPYHRIKNLNVTEPEVKTLVLLSL
jgi:hypothetical protein